MNQHLCCGQSSSLPIMEPRRSQPIVWRGCSWTTELHPETAEFGITQLMSNFLTSSPFSLVLVPLCSVKSRSIPLARHQAGQCQHTPCPGLLRGCGMLFSWKRCPAPGCGAASLGPGAAGHPSAPKGVLDPLIYRFPQITPLAAYRTCCSCEIAYFHLCRFEQ